MRQTPDEVVEVKIKTIASPNEEASRGPFGEETAPNRIQSLLQSFTG
jgi:hypothetical protein